jgi:hypothetical protein
MGDDTSAPAPVKPGWKTTEFWLHLIAVLAGAIMASGLPSQNKIVQVAGMISATLGALGYGATRAIVKAAGVFLLCLMLTSCCSINKDAVKAATDSEVDLMTELSAYVDSDAKKSDDLKAAEKARIKAHLDLVNALRK